MRLLVLFAMTALLASGQVVVHGGVSRGAETLGIAGSGWAFSRLYLGAEAGQGLQAAWRGGFAGVRAWRGLYIEGGAGAMRTKASGEWQELIGVPFVNPWCPRKCEPLGVMDEIVTHTYRDVRWRAFASVGAYYQTPGRVFVRAGYRRLFVRGDHDTNQIYTSVGVTF